MTYQPPTISLDGITLEMIVSKLVEVYGWEELGKALKMKCFTDDPSIVSSLKFLRKTPWARKKVEAHYLKLRKAQLKKQQNVDDHGGVPMSRPKITQKPDVRNTVRIEYGKIAGKGGTCCGTSCCGSPTPETLAENLGYSAGDLAQVPAGANLGLSCGNPTAVASLREGDIVLDLGSGAGFDVFVAARKVGASGQVIGVDMTPEMLMKARKNLEEFRRSTKLENTEFRLGEIEHLPLADASVNVVISNCVINLSPDKPQVWREIFRVLKKGGRVAVSDLALRRPLPDAVRRSVEALVGCVAGAALLTDITMMLKEAGFSDIKIEEKPGNIQAMVSTNSDLYKYIMKIVPQGLTLDDFVTSAAISAKKK